MQGQTGGHQFWGRIVQLRCLRTGRHPRTKEPLSPAIDEDGQCYAYDRGAPIERSRLEGRKAAKTVGNCKYPDATSSIYTSGSSAAEKMRLRLERVRAMQKVAETEARAQGITAQALRRLRGKQRPGSAWADVFQRESTCSEPAVSALGRPGPPRSFELRWLAMKSKCTDLTCCRFGCDGVRSCSITANILGAEWGE